MSVPVAVEDLRGAVARYGVTAFLLTVSDDVRPHAVSVVVAWDGDRLRMGAGRRTRTNVVARPEVSLVWPPVEAGGYSLIVDGTGSVSDDEVVLVPRTGVLHRSARGEGAGAGVAGACGADCLPVGSVDGTPQG
jgi:hypothetical protein